MFKSFPTKVMCKLLKIVVLIRSSVTNATTHTQVIAYSLIPFVRWSFAVVIWEIASYGA